MQTKLTLRIDTALIKKTKKYAKEHGKSLSQMVADYFFLVTVIENKNAKHAKQPTPQLTQALKGILRNKHSSEEAYKKHLEDKYL